MRKDGFGGANTKTGLVFEERVDLVSLLTSIDGYEAHTKEGTAGIWILHRGREVARAFKKHAFYSFLSEHGVDWRTVLSKRLLPDDTLLVIVRETLFVIEVKFQSTSGSVDEKLQTCDFKKKRYQQLVKPLGLKVEYVYVLNDWFKASVYRDTLEYIESVNCHYQFNSIPLAWLGLPTS
jgi:hypothetical protein